MAIGQDKRSVLKTQAGELIKQYHVYDGSDRLTDIYTANTDTPDGGNCSRVQYEYDGVSSRVVKMKETIGTWSSSYDI